MTARVLMLTADRQIDRRILNSATSLRTAGWEVVIVGAPVDLASATEPGVVRIGSVFAEATRESLVAWCYRWLRTRMGRNSRLIRWLKQRAWYYLVDHETFHAKLYWPTIKDIQATVIVANDLPMLPVAARLADTCGARLVYDSHELYSEQEFPAVERKRWQTVERKYIGRCDAVITVNESIANELERRYSLSGVHIILNAERCSEPPNPSRYWHETYRLPADALILLFQGGLSANRNLEQMVQAMHGLQNPAVHLVLLGDGEMQPMLAKLVQRHQLIGRVHLHPAVPQDRLLALTAAADAGIIPYQAICLNNLYCTPNKMFEFIAAGLPILASDLPEIRRIVVGYDIGTVADVGNADQIRAKIQDFFAVPARLVHWRRNLQTTRSLVSWEVEAKKLLRIYEPLR